jgi:putative phosphoribosyl transferase
MRAEDEKRVREIEIPAKGARLKGDLRIPNGVRGLILFAHGSGSSRHSPRNQYVAGVLQEAGFATLLFDLLTEAEERIDRSTAELRFDIELLTERLVQATAWIAGQEELKGVRMGYFGASTGAAAALVATARVKDVAAVVSRGGRPDLAGTTLSRVSAPVLLIVGSEDRDVLALNEAAAARLTSENTLEVIPGATHLFEEPGAMEQVAQLARRWFERFLGHDTVRNEAA